jgi:hypothetical protein
MSRAVTLLLALTTATLACSTRIPSTPVTLHVREPASNAVESVIFLIGDAGKGTLETSPILHRLRTEVEQWSQSLRDSGVVVLYLGDNVYPGGVHDDGDEHFSQDSTHLQAQLDVVAGAYARRHVARAVFIAGNHDWGHLPGGPGRDRLSNMQRFVVRRARAGKFHADFEPLAGDPGPSALYLGRHFKVLLIDTAWWLLEADYQEKLSFLRKLEREMVDLRGRELLIAAHHPWQSGSAHGGINPFWRTIGVRWLLSRSGAMLQDLNSLPYRDLKNQLNATFRRHAPPLLFAGGHDHNLQILRATIPTEPRFSIVSGAGSKSSVVGPTEGTVFHRSDPGYMRLLILKDGSVDLFVVSAQDDFRECRANEEIRRRQCLENGAREFRTVFSLRLK